MSERKYFIDWVRVLAFFLLIGFHCAMPFVIFGWEIKNKEQSLGLSRLLWWLHQWRIPLLFFVSGVGTHFSLARRSVISFAGERVVRLFIPLLFAMFFTIPFQVYFEWMQKGRIALSYADFYPQVWQMVPYPDGALTWSHMWFVVYLFVFSMLLIPVFSLLKIKGLQRLKELLADKLSHPWIAGFLFLPLPLYYFTLFIKYPEQQSLLDDWFVFLFSLTLFFYGFLLGGSDKFWQTCEKYRIYYLGIAIICIVVLYYRYWWNLDLPKQNNASLYWYGTLNSIEVWFLILTILGFAKKYLNFNNSFLQFTNQAVYPFYILHQTIIVAAGYYIVQLNIPILPKLILLILITFISIFLIYKYLIKPFILIRILFGVKFRKRKQEKPVLATQ
jgi:hypothetical protein